MFGFQNPKSIVIQNETFRRNKATKKMVFRRKDLHRKCRPANRRKKSKWSKFTCLTHHIRSEFGFQNHRTIFIQNGTFKGNKALKKMIFKRIDQHRKCRPRNGRKSQDSQNSRV